MLGAIIGDIVGSAYEFNATNDYNFKLFPNNSGFTDDTVCTVAVADALMHPQYTFGESIHHWCRKYPYPKGGYGGRFNCWVASKDPKPYGSFGNGSAMRVSPVGWWYHSQQEVLEAAKATADCTHNHPEGVKGAQTVALAIFLANKARKEGKIPDAQAIVKECVAFSGYNIDIDWNWVRNKFDETCQGTVPVALAIIRDSRDFEDAIRRAVSLGADADTLGAIVGSIAEPIWGIPEWMKTKALDLLHAEMKKVLSAFRQEARSRRLETKEESVKAETAGVKEMKYTPNNIKELKEDEIFVFGSNLGGHHGGGAARVAHDKFGAEWGVGVGITGRCYAIPTMQGGVETIKPYVDEFIALAREWDQTTFLVTRIGCGIAGFTDEQIAPLFAEAADLYNVRLPKSFVKVIKGISDSTSV